MMSSSVVPMFQNLPQTLDRLIGREADLDAAEQQFSEGRERLFTVLGPGGVGKTRFALELAWRLQDRFVDGVLWLECSELRSPDEVLRQLCSLLSVRGAVGLESALERALRGRHLLLILDNLEQISGMGVQVLAWLCTTPNLCVLTTSRRALRVSGERRYPLSPLERPPTHAAASQAVILSSSAVQLFLERTRAVRPDFNCPSEQLSLLAQLCENLDGLPLALEIAASQMALFELPALLEASRQPQTLSWWGAGRPLRQRSLEHSLYWGYCLLEPQAQWLLQILGALRGGFLRETALSLGARLGGEQSWEQSWEQPLEELFEQSWLRRDGERFFLLESVRGFARGLLHKTSRLPEVEAALWQHYQSWTTQTLTGLGAKGERIARGHLALEWTNLRSALEWAIGAGHEVQVVNLLDALFYWCGGTGKLAEMLTLLERVLDVGEKTKVFEPENLALVLSRAGKASVELGDYERAKSLLERAGGLTHSLGNSTLSAYVQRELGNLHLQQGHLDWAGRALEQATELYQSLNQPKGMAHCLWFLGRVRYNEQKFEEAERLFERHYVCQRQAHAPESVPLVNQALMLFSLSMTKRGTGDLEQALVLQQQALELSRTIDHWRNIAYSQSTIGLIQLELGRRKLAAQAFAELERIVETHHLAQESTDLALSLALFDLAEARFQRVSERIFKVLEDSDAHEAQNSTSGLALPLCILVASQAQQGQLEGAALMLGAARQTSQNGTLPFDYDGAALVKKLELDLETALGSRFLELLEQGRKVGHIPLLAQMGLTLRHRSYPLASLAPVIPESVKPMTATRLSAREQTVLEGMARGETNRTIAALLELSQNTVRSYSVSLFNKLGCKTRAQAVAMAKELGWL